MAETAGAPEVARQDPNGGAIDCKQVWCKTGDVRYTDDLRLLEGSPCGTENIELTSSPTCNL